MTDHLEQACSRSFARHETFHPRYGWLGKAVAAVSTDPSVFTAEDATVQLGVGKNMVRAIRYWAGAAKLIESTAESTSRSISEQPTHNGRAIFGPQGADPYLEAPGTLWLAHWWLLRPQCEIPVWWIAFNKFAAVEFTESDLTKFIADEVSRSSWPAPNISSIEKDVSCLLRTYAAVKRGRAAIDDVLDCPFRNLGIIEEPSPDRFRFVLGRKPGFPSELALYAAIDWMGLQATGASTASVSRLASEPGSPGRAFKMGEQAMSAALSEAAELTGVGAVSSGPTGRQLAVEANLDEAKHAVLKAYYARVNLPLRLGLDPSNYLAVQP